MNKKKISSCAAIAMLIVAFPSVAFSETYEECILKNMKGIDDKAVASSIRAACREKTLPKKCRDIRNLKLKNPSELSVDEHAKLAMDDPSVTLSTGVTLEERCVAECQSAGWWSRTFGECSP